MVKGLLRKLKLRTWIALGVITIFLPVTFMAIYGVFGASSGSSANPAAHWAFDEASANTCSDGTSDACDSSGNGNDGAFGAAAPDIRTEDLCVSGKCLLFNGTDDTVTVANTVSNIQTVTFWVKVMSTSTTQEILALNASDTFSSVNGTVTVAGFGTDTIYVDGKAGSTTLQPSRWHHVAVTTTTAFSGSAITMGNISTNFGNIFLDEVKLFTSQLTADQVRAEFAGGAAVFGDKSAFLSDGLVGYWPMDEAAGDGCPTALADSCDKSGNTNDGTWNNQVATVGGKFGNSTDLDGTDDFIDVGAGTSLDVAGANQNFTIAMWIRRDSAVATTDMLFSSGTGASSGILFAVDNNDADRLEFGSVNNTVLTQSNNAVVGTTAWQHVAVTANRTGNLIFYVNGVEAGSTNISSLTSENWNRSAGVYKIGRDRSGIDEFGGLIDEARVYNRALSSKEIQALYNWAPGPRLYYTFDESVSGDAKTIIDRSGNAINGTTEDGANNTGMNCSAEGKFGKACEFDGVDDRIAITDNDIFNPKAFTLAYWINVDNIIGDFRSIWARTGDPFCAIQITSGKPYCYLDTESARDAVVANTAISVGVWNHVAYVFTSGGAGQASTLKIYINGVLDITNSLLYQGDIDDNTNTHYIGAYTDSAWPMDGRLDEIKVYDYPRSSQQVVEDMNGGHPAGGSPISSQVAYWALDEQQGATINNSATTSLTATRTGATWRTKENCRVNGCLDFDGADDDIAVTDANAISFDEGLESGFTISAWIYPDAAGEGSGGRIYSKGTNTWLRVDTLSGGFLDLEASHDLATTDATVNASARITQSAWNHVAMSWSDDSDDEVTLWVNGLAVATSTNGDDAGTEVADANTAYIGGDGTGAGNTQAFDGRIDEFQIYSSELTADQIKVVRNFGSVNSFGVGSDEASQITGGAGNPPVGWWSMDDNTGTSAVDKSGNGYTGTLAGGPTWAGGKIGPGVSFDGSNDRINTTHIFANDSAFTISFWMFLRGFTSGDVLIQADDVGSTRFTIEQNGTNTLAACNNGVCADFAQTSTNAVSTNTWQYVTFTYDGTPGASSGFFYINGVNVTADSSIDEVAETDGLFNIGARSGGGDSSNTIIDEVKVYDYVRSQAQIAYDFNRGGPVGWWQMDECSGGTANNNGSGTSIDGTLSGASAPNTGNGDCTVVDTATKWYNGRTGKFNASLDFDDVDDIVTVTDNNVLDLTNGLSISAWVNVSANEVDNVIVSKGTSYELGVDGSGNVYWDGAGAQVDDGAGRVATGSWQHIVITNDDTTVTYYVNGVTTGTDSAGIDTDNATNLIIGGDGTNFFDGLIDDVRIYNYVLSAGQIRKLYDSDAGARFGPATGSP